MTYQDKIQKAKAKLMLEHPYFGTIASSLQIQKSDDVESFVSDGKILQYNDEYFDSVAVNDVEFALANGAMHSLLKHEKRLGSRYDWLWQLATDYTINSMLVKNGLTLPEKANFQDRFDGMYAEEVYEVLRSEIKNQEWSEDEGTAEEDQDAKDNSDNETKEQQRTEVGEGHPIDDADRESNNQDNISQEESENLEQEFLEQVFKKMNRQGTLPKDLKYLVPEYFSHTIDWREQLYRYIASHAKSSFSFVPPNMKYLYRGIYLPSLSSDLLRVVVAIDTSGSVDETLLGTFLAEVQSITEQYPNYEIDIITADSQIQSHEVFLPGETLNYEVQGRGGTDFRPVFEYIDKYVDYPTLLLYFTDGFGTFPESEPNYDILWVMAEEIEVPFGEVVLMDI